jgi:hypothetical protein
MSDGDRALLHALIHVSCAQRLHVTSFAAFDRQLSQAATATVASPPHARPPVGVGSLFAGVLRARILLVVLLAATGNVTKTGKVRSVVSRTRMRSRSPRRLVQAFARLLCAVVVLAGITHSGARYFYCEALGLASADPCLESARGDAERCPTDAVQGHRADCCEVITLPSVPNGARSEGPGVLPASIVAVVSAEQLVGRALDDEQSSRIFAFGRWREPPRSSQRARARLMVFLT